MTDNGRDTVTGPGESDIDAIRARKAWYDEDPYERYCECDDIDTLLAALEQARGDAAAAEEQNAVLQAQLNEIDRTMAVVGVGPFKTWKDAQMQAYDAVRALSAQVNTLQAYIEDLETLVLADSADPAPGAKDGTS